MFEEHINNIKQDYSCGKEMPTACIYTLDHKDMQALVQFEGKKINEWT